MDQTIQLKGRVFITFNIEAVTGLHIGGSDTGIEIGGVDKTVIRDPMTNRPYIPGSSLRGKMRSLTEKYLGLPQNQRVGQSYIHSCQDRASYQTCPVCQIYGVPGERDFATPTRLVVRDVMMSDKSADELNSPKVHTDLPYTEVKTEVSIDRVTSAANPRQMERVPAGTVFGTGEMVYSIYEGAGCDAQADVFRLKDLFLGMQLLEDDYLGGLGSRGSGKVRFLNIKVELKGKDYKAQPEPVGKPEYESLADLMADEDAVIGKIANALLA